jgi:hypothetical protein
LNRNWDPLNLDVRYPELFPDRLCHQLTQFKSKTGGLAFVVFERKRRCVGAVGDPVLSSTIDFRRLSEGIGVCADALAREAKSARESIAKRNIVMPPMSWCEAFLSNLT